MRIVQKDPYGRLAYKNQYKLNQEITIVKFDPEDQFLAIGCADGFIYVYEMPRGDKASPIVYGSQDVKPEVKLPVTGIRWVNKHTMVTSNTDGTITYWNTKNG